MFPVKVEIHWIQDSRGLWHPCEREFYEDTQSEKRHVAVDFCYPFSHDADSEFARFLTRVAQENEKLPETTKQQIDNAIAASLQLIAVVKDLQQQEVDLKLLEQITDIYGLALIEEDLEAVLTNDNPRITRFVLMQNMNSEEYFKLVKLNNEKRSKRLQELRTKES